jgi:protein tyrosine phosphatase (PTP) superfamily phosphohydrolase (DUF442 family)
MTFYRAAITALAAGLACAIGSCQTQLSGTPAVKAPVAVAAAVPSTQIFVSLGEDSHLENAHVVTAKLVSGAQPEGEESFRALRQLGIQTIISVDGAQPDVATARRFGLRYVHLPITYSTVTPGEGRAIAKAIDELPGPIYLHCHHGKHRAAAAAAVACVYNGSLRPEQAESVLKTFGTGANYTGLWKSAREARPLGPEELRDLNVRYVERAEIPKVAMAMVSIDGHFDNLKLLQKSAWTTPADHPDLDPPHEALQLEEHFREVARTADAKARPEDYRRLLDEAERASARLRGTLAATPARSVPADAALKVLGVSCTACHKAYRD